MVREWLLVGWLVMCVHLHARVPVVLSPLIGPGVQLRLVWHLTALRAVFSKDKILFITRTYEIIYML